MASPTGILFNDPRAKPTSVAGLAQAGAYYQYYFTQTLNLASVYKDGALTVPADQTIGTGDTTLASDGRMIPIYLNPNTIYRVQLYSAVGALLEDTDPYIVPSVSATTVGLAIYPQTQAEINAGVTPVNYGFPSLDMRRYGYLADGATDNATPLASAVSVVAAKGGTLLFPPGVGLFSSFPSLAGLTNIIFQGVGAANSGATFGTTLVFTGVGTGTVVNANSTTGVQFRGIQFQHNNAGFTGLYFSFRNSTGNSFMCALLDCVIGANVGTGVTHVNLDKAQNWTAERCKFIYGNPSIKGQANGGGSFSNVIVFRDCHWSNSLSTPIVWGGESWVFDHCTGEPLNSGVAGFFDGGAASNVSKAMNFVNGCWFGDVTAGGGTWITYYGFGLNVIGNRFGGFATGTQAISLNGVTGGIIRGNHFDTFSAVVNYGTTTNSNIDFSPQANSFVNCTSVYGNGGNIRQRNQIVYSAAMAIDASTGPTFDIVATNGTAFTINNPTNPQDGEEIEFWISNTSGGALGAVTFGTAYKLAGAWVSPATANNRSIRFGYRAIATAWYEINRTAADAPN